MARTRIEQPLAGFALVAALAASTPNARADEDATARARAAFVEGTELVKKAQWAEALAAFERAAQVKPHALTTSNIGACERAMGRYTRARARFAEAIAQNEAAGGAQLSPSLVEEARGYIAQIDGVLAKIDIALDPGSAAVAIDGRPLEARSTGTLVAGTRPPGPGEPPASSRFTVVLDPGAHVFTFTRPGFREAVLNKTFGPGSTSHLDIALDSLPATLHIAANRPGALVTVEGADVGPVPADVLRPAGTYRVVVRKTGFTPYETTVSLRPGQELRLSAPLREDKPAITQRWWFWTAAGVVVAGAAAGTYFATRSTPAPERPEVSGGTLGWKVRTP